MTVITADLINSEFGTTVATADLEVVINSAIDTVNSDAGTSIGYLVAGTITVTANEAAAIKPMVAMKLASRSTSGASSTSLSIGGLSTSQSASSSTGDVNAEQYLRAIERLKGSSIGLAMVVGQDTADLDSIT